MPDIHTIAASTAKSGRSRKPHGRYAALLVGVVSFVSNVTAITGLILSHADIIVITAAVLATLSGLYLLLKRWGKPTDWATLLAVGIIVAGSVMLALSLKAYNDNTPTSTPAGQNSSPSSPGVSSTGGGGTPVKKNSTHTVVFEKNFKLTNNDGLELDDEQGTILLQQSSPQPPSDLYFSSFPYLAVSKQKFYQYQAPLQSTGDQDKDQYNACTDLIANSQLGSSTLSQSQVSPGKQYCITTTQGRVALITLQEMIDSGYGSGKNDMTFAVKLWN